MATFIGVCVSFGLVILAVYVGFANKIPPPGSTAKPPDGTLYCGQIKCNVDWSEYYKRPIKYQSMKLKVRFEQ